MLMIINAMIVKCFGICVAYPGQAPFGSVPYAGIEVNDVVMAIGNADADSNWFYNMNIGVIGHRSALKVVNNKFSLVQIDTAITSPNVWDGTAIASLGDHDSSIVGKLIVRPVNSGAWTVDNCRQGVYTDFSDLDVRDVKMTRMQTGIFSTRCFSPMQSVVEQCVIEAAYIGIDWQNNNGSVNMIADGNSIYMTGAYTYGILMQEFNTTATANYRISGNYVEMNDGMFGITGMNLFRSEVVSNIVKLSGSTSPVASGIAYKGGLNNVIQCNIVDGDNATDTTRAGIVVNISESTQVLCNRTDETGFGVFFGGINPATSFRGNTMIDHFNGLRLNSVAVIDTQSHAGNRWIGSYTDTLGNWGAVNMNADSAQALAFSLFEVNPTPDAALLPSTPGTTAPPVWPNDNGWFLVLTNGDPFACDSIYACHFDHEEEKSSSEELKMAIAADSTITVDFIPESKAVAKQYLYDELKRDTALVSGNNLFNGFVNYNNSKAIGHLYETRQEFQEAFSLDSTLQNSLINTYSLLNQLIDSVFVLDSLNILNPGAYAVYRQSLIQTITSTNINITNLLDQYQTYRSGKLSTVLQKNTLVIPDEIPESHEKTINEVEVIYQTGGKDAIMGYQSIIQSIANQCPYKGGKAVYRARALASFFNNQIFYDDQAECALQGIYRSTQASIKTKQKITLIPNPADESVSIITSGFGEGLCKLQIQNSVNQITGSYIFNCSDKNYRVNTSRLSPGIYTVHITIDNKNYTLEKLVIIR